MESRRKFLKAGVTTVVAGAAAARLSRLDACRSGPEPHHDAADNEHRVLPGIYADGDHSQAAGQRCDASQDRSGCRDLPYRQSRAQDGRHGEAFLDV